MKLSKITITDYRGFYGKNVIEFETEKKSKNISLVIARNDTGKTTLLNAIYWCLYGDEQFYSMKNSNKRIMSHKKIVETSLDRKMKVSVSLVFNDDKGPKYEITRERIFKRAPEDEDELKIIPQGEDILMGMKMNPKGTGFESIEHMEDFIARNIPRGISTFFILDGEQLKSIFSSDINYQIRDAIERVANIGALNGMIDNLKQLDSKYARAKSGMDPNFGALQKSIDEIEGRIKENEKNLEQSLKEKLKFKKQMQEIENYLEGHNEEIIREYGARDKRIREENERIVDEKTIDENQLNSLIIEAYILENSKKAVNVTIKKFEEIMNSDNFPPAVEPAHVFQLLKRKECICGNKISKGSNAEERLEKLANTQSYKEYFRIISQGDAYLPQMIKSLSNKINIIGKLRKKISDYDTKLQKNEKELSGISQKLKDSNADEIRERAEEKDSIGRAIIRVERDILGFEKDIDDLKSVKKEAEIKLNNIKIKTAKDQLIIKKSEKCRALIKYAEEIKSDVMKTIKDNIQEATAKNFRELHYKAKEYEKVTIDDNFSLSIRDKYGGQLINELSQGAALCFGLAFMTALRNYSGYDVPIIIDSPVGKIDEGNRESIAKNIPNQLKDRQIIFLVTGSEYTSVFKEFLESQISTKVNLTHNPKSGGIDIT
jgi:DNA sulfur modification protein DndD